MDRDLQTVIQLLQGLTEGIAGLDRRMGSLEERMGSLEDRMERAEARLDQIEIRLDRHDRYFELIQEHLLRIDARFEGVETRLTGVEIRLEQVEGRLSSVEAKVDQLELGQVELRKEVRARSEIIDRRLALLVFAVETMDNRLDARLRPIELHLVSVDDQLRKGQERFDRWEGAQFRMANRIEALGEEMQRRFWEC